MMKNKINLKQYMIIYMDHKIIKELKIDSIFTKTPPKQKIFNHVKNTKPPIRGYNYQADLLYLPKTEEGYEYLLVVVDLANNAFDIEPLKNRDAKSTLDAFKNMFKRKFIKKPEISVRTDPGSEFGKEFDKYLKDNKIFHSVSLKNRHKQMANVENLNKQLGNVFNHYMNKKEQELDEQYNEWDDIINTVRTKGNKYRTLPLPKYKEWNVNLFDPVEAGEAKYKIGDFVYYKLDTSKNALNKENNDGKFRMGDLRYDPNPKKIVKVIYMSDRPYYRYMLDGIKRASYAEMELLPAKDIKESKYYISKFLKFRTQNKKRQVLVRWQNMKKENDTWQDVEQIIQDIGAKSYNDYVKKYNEEFKKRRKEKLVEVNVEEVKPNKNNNDEKIDKELEKLEKELETDFRRSQRIKNKIKIVND